MPVDAQLLEQTIQEAVHGDAELAALLKQKLAANDSLAASFTGGFTRTADYTRKSQALADDRNRLAEDRKKIEGQMEQYRTALEAAETEKAKILRDLAQHKVTTAEAQARLQAVKETYQLSDEDIPPMRDLIATRKTEKPQDSTADLDARLDAFRKDFEKTIAERLLPELSSMTDLDIIWANMRDEHRELTGKRLSADDQRAILKEAREKGRKLVDVWEEKFAIPDARKKQEYAAWEKEARGKWDAEQTAKRSQEALEGVRPGAADETGLRLSPVLKKQFAERGVDPGQTVPQTPGEVKPGEHVRTMPSGEQRQALTGAERAAKRFLERRANGIQMGQPDAVKSA
ncbi:MAG TPA: hypothetical protein VEL77_15275 [Rugosimonospora sp.]|nr:hypothetical protein [Rugosimonospora sp.]